jgi:hypothetical protein
VSGSYCVDTATMKQVYVKMRLAEVKALRLIIYLVWVRVCVWVCVCVFSAGKRAYDCNASITKVRT